MTLKGSHARTVPPPPAVLVRRPHSQWRCISGQHTLCWVNTNTDIHRHRRLRAEQKALAGHGRRVCNFSEAEWAKVRQDSECARFMMDTFLPASSFDTHTHKVFKTLAPCRKLFYTFWIESRFICIIQHGFDMVQTHQAADTSLKQSYRAIDKALLCQ